MPHSAAAANDDLLSHIYADPTGLSAQTTTFRSSSPTHDSDQDNYLTIPPALVPLDVSIALRELHLPAPNAASSPAVPHLLPTSGTRPESEVQDVIPLNPSLDLNLDLDLDLGHLDLTA